MSIPWAQCSQHQFAQLAGILATFLSPVALVVFSKKISSIASRIRTHAEPGSCFSEQCHDLAPGDAFSEESVHGHYLDLNEFLREYTQDNIIFDQTELQPELKCNQKEALKSGPFCTCGSSADAFDTSSRPFLEGQGGGCGDLNQMDPPQLEGIPAEQFTKAQTNKPSGQTENLDLFRTDRSLAGDSSNQRERRNNPRSQTKDQDLEKSRPVQGCCPKDSTGAAKELTLAQELSLTRKPPTDGAITCSCFEVFTNPPEKPAEYLETAEPGSDPTRQVWCSRDDTNDTREASDSEETPTEHSQRPNSPRSPLRSPPISPRLSKKLEKETSNAKDTQSENLDSPQQISEDLRKTRGLNSMSQSDCAEVGKELQHDTDQATTPEEQHCCTETAAASTPTTTPRTDRKGREGSEVRRSASYNVLDECQAEPRRRASRSSSCESFSTANGSSSSSLIELRKAYRLPNQLSEPEQQGSPWPPTSSPKSRERRGRNPEKRERRQSRRNRQKHSMEYHDCPIDPPIFEQVTPPRFFPNLQATSTNRSNRVKRQDSATDDQDDVSGLHGGSQSEEEEAQDLFQVLASTLKSWLPHFSSSRKQKRKSSEHLPPEHQDNSNPYDIRNVLSDEQQKLWTSSTECNSPEVQVCPHSCASSLCNFRHTLESWKRELLSMHAALDASMAAISQSPCIYCHENFHTAVGLHDCHTVHIAQQFWRTVLQFRHSHLDCSDCPHFNQHQSKKRKERADEDAQQCSLGHHHSCHCDYSGCSEPSNSLGSEPGPQEAPCIHVLLNDVDTLLKRLQNLKVSSSFETSHRGHTESDPSTSMCEKAEQDHKHPNLTSCGRRCRLDSPFTSDENCTHDDTREGAENVTEESSSDYQTTDVKDKENSEESPVLIVNSQDGTGTDLTDDEMVKVNPLGDDAVKDKARDKCIKQEPVISIKTQCCAKTDLSDCKIMQVSPAQAEAVKVKSDRCSKETDATGMLAAKDNARPDQLRDDKGAEEQLYNEQSTRDINGRFHEEQPVKSIISRVDTGGDQTVAEYTTDEQTSKYTNEKFSEEKSAKSMLSLSPSISLADELADLEEFTDSIPNNEGHYTDDPSEAKTTIAECSSAEHKGSMREVNTATTSHPQDPEAMPPRARSPQVSSDSRLLQRSPSLERTNPATDQRCLSRSEELAMKKTRVLGKFAIRYLEHIEKKLEMEDVTPQGQGIIISRPVSGGDSPQPRLRTTAETTPAFSTPSNGQTPMPKKRRNSVASTTEILTAQQQIENCWDLEQGEMHPVVSVLRDFVTDFNKLHCHQYGHSKNVQQDSLVTETSIPLEQHNSANVLCELQNSTDNLNHFSQKNAKERVHSCEPVSQDNCNLQSDQSVISDKITGCHSAAGSDTKSRESLVRKESPAHSCFQSARKDPSVISAFENVIADLSKLQSGQAAIRNKPVVLPRDARDSDHSTRNAKQSVSAARRSHSVTNASPRHMDSPPLQPAGLSTSSCLSLTTSGEDVSHRDLTVTQAFDQLDKVVNDLLKLMDLQH